MAGVPENVIKAMKEAKVSVTIPKPTFQIEHKPDGSMIAQISYDGALIQEAARDIVKLFSDRLDEAIIDELARANGYIKKGE